MIAVELKDNGREMEYYFGEGNRVVVYAIDGTVMIFKYRKPRKMMSMRDTKTLARLLSRLEKLFNSQRN